MIRQFENRLVSDASLIEYDPTNYGVGIKEDDYLPLYTLKNVFEIVNIGDKEGIVYILPKLRTSYLEKQNSTFFQYENKYKAFNNVVYYKYNQFIIFSKDIVACVFVIKKKYLSLEFSKMFKEVELWIDPKILFESEYSLFKKAFFKEEARYFDKVQMVIKTNIKSRLFPYSIQDELKFKTIDESENKKEELKALFKNETFYEYIS
jgi:hypothetical protein